MLAPGLYPAAYSLPSFLPKEEGQGGSLPVGGGTTVYTQGCETQDSGGLALGHIPYPSND